MKSPNCVAAFSQIPGQKVSQKNHMKEAQHRRQREETKQNLDDD